MPRVPLAEATDAAAACLERAGANRDMARATAAACVAAEAMGQAGHGLSRIPQYAMLLRGGRADGQAVPRIVRARGGTCLIDAGDGLAYPAMNLAVEEAAARAAAHGIGCAGVTNSGHSGVSGIHVAALAARGLVGLMFTNSPSAMPLPGGTRPRVSTNPVAAAFPRAGGQAPVVIDLALSATARGKIMVAAREGRAIPEGWALDASGQPTTDAAAALKGSMLAIGGERGLALALAVELLAVALTGAAFGWEADSFFVPEGNRPRLGQLLIAIDPQAMAGEAYLARMAALAAAAAEDGVRLPGARRAALAARAEAEGISVPDALWSEISGGAAPIAPAP